MCITWAKLVGYTTLHLLELSAGSKTICMWSTTCIGLLQLSAQGLICAALWLTPLGSVCMGLYGWTVSSRPCLCFTLWLAPFLRHRIDASVCVCMWCVCACGVCVCVWFCVWVLSTHWPWWHYCSPVIYGVPVRIVVGMRWGPKRSVVSVHHIFIQPRTLNKITMEKRNETVLKGDIHKTENNHPRNTGGKRLPKYDSQSETTNDTCLWLRTIPG